jgi:RHS repeat-associated protein
MLVSEQGKLCSFRRLRLVLAATTIMSSGMAAQALAAPQPGSIAPEPVRRALDGNGVDVIRGTFNSAQPGVSIGTADKGLSYQADNMGDGFVSNLRSGIVLSGTIAIVTINGDSTSFTKSGTTYTATEGDGATLTQSTVNLTFTARDGTVVALLQNTSGSPYWDAGYARVTSITTPNGVRTDFNWKVTSYCPGGTEPTPATCPAGFKNALRLQSVTNTNGFQIKLGYASNLLNDLNIGQSYDDWSRVTSVKGINNGVEYCSPSADSCSLTGAWPSLTFGGSGSSTSTVTDSLGRATTFSYVVNGSGIVTNYKIKRPGAATDNVVATYATPGQVSSVVNEGVTYNYAYADAGNIRTTTVTHPAGSQVYTGDKTTFRILSYRDELLRTTGYTYDTSGRITRVTQPEGNYTQYTYDARGNRTQTRYVAKAGSGLADLVETATYPATCVNVKICNKPTSSTDAKGNVTDYTYDATHGGLLTATAPAPTSGGIRPQVRMTYGTAQAYYKNSGGSVVASGQNHYVLTATSTCQTTASCAGAADEVKASIGYGSQVAGTANNLYPVTTNSGSGNGTLTATTAVTYDSVGNTISVDGPLPGTADTSVAVYDAARQTIGVIGPDPDGAGALKNRAQRMTYNLDGQVTKAEVGTTIGQTPAAFAAFAPLQQTIAAYDANARKTSDTLQVGSTSYALTQYSYDALGRLDCSAVRMNIAVYGSLPAACTASTLGSAGPDRISKTIYNAASQVTKEQSAVGTADQSDEVTNTYNLNGTTATMADANGNLTTIIYDGFDRVSQTRFPTAGNGAVSSTTDYEGATYDANGNVTQRRLRDGQLINFTYDNLNRVTLKDTPNVAYMDYDITYQYDLLGRSTRATNSAGHVNAFIYDALGRMTTEQMYGSTTTYLYDLAGRRTRMTWTDGFYADYNRLVTGEVSAIRENGAASGVGVLGIYAYNDLGQMTTLTRGNGTVTSYAYDPVARLASLTHDLGGTTHDVSTTFAYNPASQIASSTRSNDLYKWNGHYNIDRPYTVNGLNQLTTAGTVALGYDGRGNLTSSGSSTYGYTSENRLATSPQTTTYLGYEPSGNQILQFYNGGTATDTRFGWSGGAMISEMNAATGGTITRRYVHGPGADAPLVWYEGAGTTDKRWLIPDERGSIVAMTNASGTVTAVNSYDEYGIPASTNVGRFQYTGQAWLPEIGMYYYKARMYSATLGRFMQTDPIGYGAGMNMYGYVGGDPVNFNDPLGLKGAAKDAQPVKPARPNGVEQPDPPEQGEPEIIVEGERIPTPEPQAQPIRIDPRFLEPVLPNLVDSPQPKRPCLGPARCETDAERKAREAREAREKAERERLRREANKRRPTCRSNAQKLAIADALGSPLTLIGQAGAKAAGLNLLFKSFNALNAPVVYFYLTGKTFNYLSDC